jgi:AMP deaminase
METVEAGSEESWDEREDKEKTMLPEGALMPDGTPDTSPSENEDGMLPRDKQRKTAYYDYAAEKQLSQADAKLFYQRSQLEAEKTSGSNWGNSQASPEGSPVTSAGRRTFSGSFDLEKTGLRKSGSMHSTPSRHNTGQRFVTTGGHRNEKG